VIHLEVLAPAQRAFWEVDAPKLPGGWVLYGGTAVALHLGHRRSVDFDFFSTDRLDREALRSSSRTLERARTVQDEPETITVIAERRGEPVKLSFFGALRLGRVGDPLRVPERPPIASRLDLLATKLATVTQRIEPRDYLDIAALLSSGLTIDRGIAAMIALYGPRVSGLASIKTIAWFEAEGLRGLVPDEVKLVLTTAAAAYDPGTRAMRRRARRLC